MPTCWCCRDVAAGQPRRRRRDARRPGLAAGNRPVPRRPGLGRRRGAGGRVRPGPADHPVLRLALEDRGPRPRRRPAAGHCGGRVLPLALPQRHAARRGGGRRPPRDQPRPRHERRRPRAARRGVGALGRAGRAGRPHGRRPPRRGVARATGRAACRARAHRGGSGSRTGGARAARRRPVPVGTRCAAPRPATCARRCSPGGRGRRSRSRRRSWLRATRPRS